VPAAAPRTGGGGMASRGSSPWQQLAGIGVLLALGIGALVALRLRRAA
jgi:hypothetical protein